MGEKIVIRTRTFDIAERDKYNIYEVTWDWDKSEEMTEACFDNYTDAYLQYEHLKKLNVENVKLSVVLLPFVNVVGEIND